MKKFRIFAFSLCLFLLSFPVLAEKATEKEDIYADVCPVNVQYAVLQDDENPLLQLTVFNATTHPISYLEFSLRLGDETGSPILSAEENLFLACAPNLNLPGCTTETLHYSVKDFPGAKTVWDFQIDKLIFSDDTEWTHPETDLYAKAYLYAGNLMTPNGQYILENNVLRLTDYSFSSYARTWFMWDDAVTDWVAFSQDLVAECPVTSSGITIKLEINHNPLLYEIASFTIASPPNAVGIQAYATAQTEILTPVSTLSDGESKPKGAPEVHLDVPFVVGDAPCVIGLWDYTDAGTRTWDIWDGTAWVTFSYDRGPICEIWRTGTIYLRLSYPEGSAVYALSIQGTDGM